MGKDRNPLRAQKWGVRWVRDVGMGWERAGVCALGVEQGGQELKRSRSRGVGNDRLSFRAWKTALSSGQVASGEVGELQEWF